MLMAIILMALSSQCKVTALDHYKYIFAKRYLNLSGYTTNSQTKFVLILVHVQSLQLRRKFGYLVQAKRLDGDLLHAIRRQRDGSVRHRHQVVRQRRRRRRRCQKVWNQFDLYLGRRRRRRHRICRAQEPVLIVGVPRLEVEGELGHDVRLELAAEAGKHLAVTENSPNYDNFRVETTQFSI